MIILRTFYVLMVTIAGVFYCYQSSINTYWTQTHHTDSPIVRLEQWWTGQSAVILTEEASKEAPEEASEAAQEPIEEIEVITAEAELSASEITAPEAVETTISHAVEEAPEESLPDAKVQTAAIAPAIVLESLHERETQSHDAKDAPIATPKEIVLSEGDQLFFVGDSLMQGVAPKVQQMLYKAHKIGGIDLSKQSTGLSYPKFFNWPQVVEETLQKNPNIKAMFVFLGPNDPWDFPIKGQKYYLRFKSDAWEAAYRERIQRILKAAQSKQIPVVWLGVPCMRKTKLHKDVIYLNGLYADEVKRFHGHFIPTYDLLGCSEEKYSAYAKTAQGNAKVRTDDGIHFTVRGQKMLADRIIEELTIESTAEETK